MKKLILLITISSVLFGEINDVENPNGQPFTLNLSLRYELPKDDRVSERVLSAKMPISSWFTIKGGYYTDRYSITGVKYSSSNSITHSEIPKIHDIWYIGYELHLPIYKLWEK